MPKKKKAARKSVPRIQNIDSVRSQILTLIRRGTTLANAAESAGIHRDTFYDWVTKGEAGDPAHAQFAVDVRGAKAHAQLAIFMIVRQSMGAPKGPGQPDATHAVWWLKTRDREEYADHHVVTGPSGGPIQVESIDFSQLPDEELKKIIADPTYRPRVVARQAAAVAAVAVAVAVPPLPESPPHAEDPPSSEGEPDPV